MFDASNERPPQARAAVFCSIFLILIFAMNSASRFVSGDISGIQLSANLFVLCFLFFLPWRLWKACTTSLVIYIFLVATWLTSSIFNFWGGQVHGLDRVYFVIAILVELASIYFLKTKPAANWFRESQKARMRS